MHRPTTVAAALAALTLVAGCGSSQPESNAGGSGAEAPQRTGTAQQSTGTTTARTQTTATTPPEESGSSSGGEPAFVETTRHSTGGPVQEAQSTLREHGYAPVDPGTYRPSQTLRVMVGKGPAGENAFFFIGNRYIGTDAKTASTSVTVAAQGEGSVTLRYTLYTSGRPAGTATVTFNLENGKLQPAQSIPPAARRNAD